MAPIGITQCKPRRRVQIIRIGIGLPGLAILTVSAAALWWAIIALVFWL